MAAGSAEAEQSWNRLDEDTREWFINDYLDRMAQRELYDEYVWKIGATAISDYLE